MQPRLVQELVGGDGESVKMDSDRSFVIETRWGRRIKIKTSTYPLLDDEQSAQSYPIPVSETTDIGRDTVSRFDWQYYVTPATGRVGKKLKVSGEPVMAIELNRQTESQVRKCDNFFYLQDMKFVSASRKSKQNNTTNSIFGNNFLINNRNCKKNCSFNGSNKL